MLSVVKARYHHPVKPWEEHSSGLAGEGRLCPRRAATDEAADQVGKGGEEGGRGGKGRGRGADQVEHAMYEQERQNTQAAFS